MSATTGYGADVGCSEPRRVLPLAETLFKEPVRLRALRFGVTASVACQAVAPQGAEAGGEYRARTGDLLVANQALSQLS